MATYKGIQGYSVQKLSEDPPAAQSAGQLWYNSASGAFKISVAGAGAWASGGNVNHGRSGPGATLNATVPTALIFSGEGTPTVTLDTEQYDGTSWTEVNNMNTAGQGRAGAGINTAGLAFSGLPSTANTETYNGTSWAETNNLNTARYGARGAGTSTGALCFAGTTGGADRKILTETWNGTSWSETADLNTARTDPGGLGTTNTASMCMGGNTSPGANFTANSETWNGTSWAEGNNILVAKQNQGASGTTTAGLMYGGNTPSDLATTESYDGTSWTEIGDMGSAKSAFGACGVTTASAIAAAGNGKLTSTEEYADPAYTIKTVTVS